MSKSVLPFFSSRSSITISIYGIATDYPCWAEESRENEVNFIAEIKVHGNVAVVHYYITAIEETSEGPTATKARWTDVLMNQGNKWVMIADNGWNMPQ
jgi:hypothetical protein